MSVKFSERSMFTPRDLAGHLADARRVLRADLAAEIRKLIGKPPGGAREDSENWWDGWNAAIEAAAKVAEGEK